MADLHDLAKGSPLSRRGALAWVGGLGLAAFVSACADDGASSSPAASTASDGSAASGTVADCVLAPELTEGPFYLDLDLVRSDITEGRAGLPLDLRVNVVDADACEPIKDAAVDVWHCDAEGAYSGVQGAEGETFLRGIQMTDADGATEFRTIFPGWYTGRAVHIHLKVHLGGDETYTGQLFFDPAVTEAVYRTEPYAARSGPDTPNSSDGIFSQSGGVTIVAVTVDDGTSSGAVTLGVQRA